MNMKTKLNIVMGLLLLTGSVKALNMDEALNFYHQSEDKKALNILQQIDSAESKMYQAEIQMALDLDKAEEIIEAAAKAHPEHAGIQYWRGRIMGRQAGNSIFSALSYAKKSLNSFKKAVQLAPENLEYINGLMMFYLNAPSIAGGDEAKAIEILEALKLQDAEAGANAQMRYIRATAKKNTTEQMLAVTKANPMYASLSFQLAQWYQHQEKYKAAFDTYHQALTKLTPEETELKCNIWYQQAKTTVLSKSEFAPGEQAIHQYIEQCEISRGMPGKDWAAYRRANILELNGRAEEAKRVYQSIIMTSDEELKKQLKKKV